MSENPDTVRFSTKGQVVIPLRLRQAFEIVEGTTATVQETPEGILLKPVTAALVRRGRGVIGPKGGGKRLAQEWAEHRKQERDLEDRHAR